MILSNKSRGIEDANIIIITLFRTNLPIKVPIEPIASASAASSLTPRIATISIPWISLGL